MNRATINFRKIFGVRRIPIDGLELILYYQHVLRMYNESISHYPNKFQIKLVLVVSKILSQSSVTPLILSNVFSIACCLTGKSWAIPVLMYGIMAIIKPIDCAASTV